MLFRDTIHCPSRAFTGETKLSMVMPLFMSSSSPQNVHPSSSSSSSSSFSSRMSPRLHLPSIQTILQRLSGLDSPKESISPVVSTGVFLHDQKSVFAPSPILPMSAVGENEYQNHLYHCTMSRDAELTSIQVIGLPRTTSPSHHHPVAIKRRRRWHPKFCSVEHCGRLTQKNGLCHRHGGKRVCKEAHCTAKDRGNGYCIKHGGGKACDVPDCGKRARRRGFCTEHCNFRDES